MHRTMKMMVVRRRLCVRESVVNTMLGVRELPVAKVKVLNISKFTTPRETWKKDALTALNMLATKMIPTSFL